MAELEGGEPPNDEFLHELTRWAAAHRVAKAASERARLRELVDQSAAEATLTGLLVDLAESATVVTLSLAGGHRITGRVVGVGRDLVAVERALGQGAGPVLGPVLVRSDAVTAVVSVGSRRAGAGGAVLRPGGRRRAPLELTLGAALDVLAGEGAPVAVRVATEVFTGTVLACGEDLLTLRTEGPDRRAVYLPLRAVTCVELR